MSYLDYDLPEFFEEKEVTARKKHWCVEAGCKRTSLILPGTRYHRVSGKWNGDVMSIIVCLRCWKIRERLPDKLRYTPFGELLETIKETRPYTYKEI